MGTHPSGPAKLKVSDMLLSSYLSDKAVSVGRVPQGYPSNDLPFLFKILSVNTALSIQVLYSLYLFVFIIDEQDMLIIMIDDHDMTKMFMIMMIIILKMPMMMMMMMMIQL
jgi:hypothetical protein